jgi:hypothetical protein
MAEQAATARCECGRLARVTAAPGNPWVFDVVCTCGDVRVIAWSTKGPAPVFTADAEPKGESDAVSR